MDAVDAFVASKVAISVFHASYVSSKEPTAATAAATLAELKPLAAVQGVMGVYCYQMHVNAAWNGASIERCRAGVAAYVLVVQKLDARVACTLQAQSWLQLM